MTKTKTKTKTFRYKTTDIYGESCTCDIPEDLYTQLTAANTPEEKEAARQKLALFTHKRAVECGKAQIK